MKNKTIAAAVLSGLISTMSIYAAEEPPAPPAPVAPPAPAMVTATVNYPEHFSGKTEKGAFLGVSTSRAPVALLKQLKIKSGLVVDSVVADSPAEKAGLKATDILEKLGDQILINPAQLEGLIRMDKPGDKVTLSILHEGDRGTVSAELAQHDVLAMSDTDPQQLETLVADAMKMSGGTPGIRVLTDGPGDAKSVFPNLDGKIKVMTMVDKSESSDDGKKSASFESQFSDGKKQLTVVRKDAGRILTIKDMDGRQLFEGPVDTEAQQNAIPKDLQPEFREMQKLQSMTRGSTTQP